MRWLRSKRTGWVPLSTWVGGGASGSGETCGKREVGALRTTAANGPYHSKEYREPLGTPRRMPEQTVLLNPLPELLPRVPEPRVKARGPVGAGPENRSQAGHLRSDGASELDPGSNVCVSVILTCRGQSTVSPRRNKNPSRARGGSAQHRRTCTNQPRDPLEEGLGGISRMTRGGPIWLPRLRPSESPSTLKLFLSASRTRADNASGVKGDRRRRLRLRRTKSIFRGAPLPHVVPSRLPS